VIAQAQDREQHYLLEFTEIYLLAHRLYNVESCGKSQALDRVDR